jgi:hypothetical protein
VFYRALRWPIAYCSCNRVRILSLTFIVRASASFWMAAYSFSVTRKQISTVLFGLRGLAMTTIVIRNHLLSITIFATASTSYGYPQVGCAFFSCNREATVLRMAHQPQGKAAPQFRNMTAIPQSGSRQTHTLSHVGELSQREAQAKENTVVSRCVESLHAASDRRFAPFEMHGDARRILVHGRYVAPKAGALPGCATPRLPVDSSTCEYGTPSTESLSAQKLNSTTNDDLAGTLTPKDPQAAASRASTRTLGRNFTAQEAAAPNPESEGA